MSEPRTRPLVIRRMRSGGCGAGARPGPAAFSLPWPERSFRYEVQDNPNSRPWVAELDG